MKRIKYVFAVVFVFGFIYVVQISAQIDCAGSQIFSERKCKGDEISVRETELLKIINDYRVQNNLPPVQMSAALSLVANRHLLDIEKNIKSMTHSWSNCPYDINDRKTWDCLFTAPQRLGTDYTGRGYENIFHDINKPASPPLALAAWKKSPLHNSLILNLDNFKNDVYDACGIAIDGNYAILWFGTKLNVQNLADNSGPKLGVTFQQATENLRNGVLFQQTWGSGKSNNKWIGISADKSLAMEIKGTKESISQIVITISVKIDENKQAFALLLKNLPPNWTDGRNWMETSVKNILKNPKNPQNIVVEGKMIEIGVDANKFIYLSVKPQKL